MAITDDLMLVKNDEIKREGPADKSPKLATSISNVYLPDDSVTAWIGNHKEYANVKYLADPDTRYLDFVRDPHNEHRATKMHAINSHLNKAANTHTPNGTNNLFWGSAASNKLHISFAESYNKSSLVQINANVNKAGSLWKELSTSNPNVKLSGTKVFIDIKDKKLPECEVYPLKGNNWISSDAWKTHTAFALEYTTEVQYYSKAALKANAFEQFPKDLAMNDIIGNTDDANRSNFNKNTRFNIPSKAEDLNNTIDVTRKLNTGIPKLSKAGFSAEQEEKIKALYKGVQPELAVIDNKLEELYILHHSTAPHELKAKEMIEKLAEYKKKLPVGGTVQDQHEFLSGFNKYMNEAAEIIDLFKTTARNNKKTMAELRMTPIIDSDISQAELIGYMDDLKGAGLEKIDAAILQDAKSDDDKITAAADISKKAIIKGIEEYVKDKDKNNLLKGLDKEGKLSDSTFSRILMYKSNDYLETLLGKNLKSNVNFSKKYSERIYGLVPESKRTTAVSQENIISTVMTNNKDYIVDILLQDKDIREQLTQDYDSLSIINDIPENDLIDIFSPLLKDMSFLKDVAQLKGQVMQGISLNLVKMVAPFRDDIYREGKARLPTEIATLTTNLDVARKDEEQKRKALNDAAALPRAKRSTNTAHNIAGTISIDKLKDDADNASKKINTLTNQLNQKQAQLHAVNHNNDPISQAQAIDKEAGVFSSAFSSSLLAASAPIFRQIADKATTEMEGLCAKSFRSIGRVYIPQPETVDARFNNLNTLKTSQFMNMELDTMPFTREKAPKLGIEKTKFSE